MMSEVLQVQRPSVWYDAQGIRYEGPSNVPETGLYPGRPFPLLLVERGLLQEADLPLCEVFHTNVDNPTLKIQSGLEHTTIGDNKAGGHLPSAMIELVPNIIFASAIQRVSKQSVRKTIQVQSVHQDGTFKIIGPNSNISYLREDKQVWRSRRNGSSTYFPVDWTCTDLLLAVNDNLRSDSVQVAPEQNNICRVSEYKGVLLTTIQDKATGKIVTAYPTRNKKHRESFTKLNRLSW